MSEVKKALRVAICRSGFTQDDIAKELGIKQPSLSKKLRGKENIDVIFILKVMEIINAPFTDIFPNIQENLRQSLTLIPEDNKHAITHILSLLMLQGDSINYENTKPTEIQPRV